MRKKYKISRLLLLFFTITYVLMATVIVVFSLFYFNYTHTESIKIQQSQIVARLAKDIDDKLRIYRTSLLNTSKIMSRDCFSNAAVAAEFLEKRPALKTMFDNGIFIVNKYGIVISSSPYNKDLVGTNVSEYEFYQIASKSKRFYISKPFRFEKNVSKPVVIIVIPVVDNFNNVIGYLNGGLELHGQNFLSDIADQRIGESGYFYLSTYDRTVIVHPDKSKILKPAAYLGEDWLYDKALLGSEESGVTISMAGEKIIGSYLHLNETEWLVAAIYPMKEANEPFVKSLCFYLILFLVILLALYYASLKIIERIITPIHSLTDEVKIISDDYSSHRMLSLQNSNTEEVEALTESFNKLLEVMYREQKRFKLIFDLAPFPCSIADPQGRYIEVNKSFVTETGLSRNHIIGKTSRELGYILEDEPALKEFRKLKEEGFVSFKDITVNIIGYGKRNFMVSAVQSPLTGQDETITFAIDITERIKMETYIKNLNEDLEIKISERTAELQNANTELASLNEELVQTNEYLEETNRDLKTAQDQLVVSSKLAALGQLVAGIAHELNTPLAAILSSNRIVEGLLYKFNDIYKTCSSLREEDYQVFLKMLNNAFRYEPLDDSGDLRSIKKEYIRIIQSTSMASHAHLLSEKLVDSGYRENESELRELMKNENSVIIVDDVYMLSTLKRAYNIIKIASEKASNVIIALKSYTFHDSGEQKKETDVLSNIDTILMLFYNKFKNKVNVVKKYTDIPQVLCYPEKLNQVWINLINNALHAMNYSGTIEIAANMAGEYAVVSVSDDGAGIPDSIKDKIFTPFFTTKGQGEGVGLGLDISEKIVKEIGGKIEFESNPGKTVFKVFLKCRTTE